jgi:hypothetical protein
LRFEKSIFGELAFPIADSFAIDVLAKAFVEFFGKLSFATF